MPFLVKKWQRISGLLADIKTTAWVTSTEWAELAREIKTEYGSSVTPTNKNFTQVQIEKNLIVRNAGTEDQQIVNLMNQEELGEKNLAILNFRKTAWQTGNRVLTAPKPEGGYIEPSDIRGNELPEELQPDV
jgi:hypothetical protein